MAHAATLLIRERAWETEISGKRLMRVNWQIINRRLIKDLHERMHAAAHLFLFAKKACLLFFYKFNCKVTAANFLQGMLSLN